MRVLLAAVALFALSTTVNAGPIWFKYRIEAETTPGGGAGEFVVNHRSPGGGWVDQATRPSAELASLWLRPEPPAHDPDWQPGYSNIVSHTTAFEIGVTLTDRAYGLSGEVTFTGSAGSQWMHRWDGLYRGEGAWISFDGTQSQELTLGQHVYTIEASQAFDPRDAEVRASISVTGSVIPNPEPGTLILSGLGLVAAGIARRRWRG